VLSWIVFVTPDIAVVLVLVVNFVLSTYLAEFEFDETLAEE
jgi:hypothetical protein